MRFDIGAFLVVIILDVVDLVSDALLADAGQPHAQMLRL